MPDEAPLSGVMESAPHARPVDQAP